MRKSDALKYVAHCLDDTGAVRNMLDMPAGKAKQSLSAGKWVSNLCLLQSGLICQT